MKHIRYQFLALLSVSALTFTSCDLIGSIDDMEPDHVVTDLNYIPMPHLLRLLSMVFTLPGAVQVYLT